MNLRALLIFAVLLCGVEYSFSEVPAKGRKPLMAAASRGGFVVLADQGLGKVFLSPLHIPQYPYESRRDFRSGSGIFRAFVTPTGNVTDVKVVQSTGHRIMDESVILAARRWRAKPGRNREVDFSMTFVSPPRHGMPGYGP